VDARTRFGLVGWATRLAAAAALVVIGAVVSDGWRGATAQAAAEAPRRPLVFIPGLLGSRLCRPNPDNPRDPIVAWGTLAALPSLSDLKLETDDEDDIRPCGLVRDVVFFGLYTQEVYSPIIARLERLGYRENKDLLIFDYDWRRSVFDNAQALAAFVRDKVGPDQPIDIVAHSMGGLIARIYAVELGGGRQIARLFSAGTPFLGSVKTYETMEKGFGALNAVMGGIAAFRRTLLSFPSIYELSPRYDVCCDVGTTGFRPDDPQAWRSLGWEGIDPTAMPDIATKAKRAAEVQRIVDTPLPAGVEDVMVIGVDQRTPYRIAFERYGGVATTRVETTWNGDGTVVRESAVLPRAAIHPTSFADHQNILNDAQVQDFLAVALTRGVGEAVRGVPVRPRDHIRSFAGVLAELIGVAVTPERLVYRPGDIGEVRVQFRLGAALPLSDRIVRLELRAPGAAAQPIALRADPGAFDPANPFEQTFVGRFAAGVAPGPRVLRATVLVEGGQTRVVEQSIGVVAR
jgi:pimeloyl-ACP methyl ester carboxylesterase